MTEDAEALRELVDRKAEDLKRDLDELGRRVVTEPKATVEAKIENVRKASAPVTSFLRNHPVVASLAAAAAGFALGFFL